MTALPDLSAYVVAGRVVSHLPADLPNETAARTPRQGIEDAVEAEALGFNRVFFSERWNLKEAGVFLGAVGAQTTTLGLGTGLVSPARRHLLHMAAFGATMQACFGERFVLGLGRWAAAPAEAIASVIDRIAGWRGGPRQWHLDHGADAAALDAFVARFTA